MHQIIAYLTFMGNCREAMTFYHQCLGGKLHLQTVGETPMGENLPQWMKDCILHASLTKKGIALMATDMVEEAGLLRGNSVSLMLECSSEAEIRDYYKKLSEKGNQTYPLETTAEGALFGGVTDQYGTQWLFQYKEARQKVNNLQT